jgi:hypothetical protein
VLSRSVRRLSRLVARSAEATADVLPAIANGHRRIVRGQERACLKVTGHHWDWNRYPGGRGGWMASRTAQCRRPRAAPGRQLPRAGPARPAADPGPEERDTRPDRQRRLGLRAARQQPAGHCGRCSDAEQRGQQDFPAPGCPPRGDTRPGGRAFERFVGTKQDQSNQSVHASRGTPLVDVEAVI